VYLAAVPFLLILMATVIVITFWPSLSLMWLE
jgi:TRAP-type mannitol/chloroaromatic compound transport system permease large subunit